MQTLMQWQKVTATLKASQSDSATHKYVKRDAKTLNMVYTGSAKGLKIRLDEGVHVMTLFL